MRQVGPLLAAVIFIARFKSLRVFGVELSISDLLKIRSRSESNILVTLELRKTDHTTQQFFHFIVSKI